ncbi:hypothetical protein PAAL109150_22460 [Paenibacillus alkaliterrae]
MNLTLGAASILRHPPSNRAQTPHGSEIELKTSSNSSKLTQIVNLELEISSIVQRPSIKQSSNTPRI